MPTYDYQCPKCDNLIEQFHGMTQSPRVKCPECGTRMKKLLGTGAGIIFKGEGFYTTDYRSSSYKAAAKADSSKPKTDAKSSTSSNGTSTSKAAGTGAKSAGSSD